MSEKQCSKPSQHALHEPVLAFFSGIYSSVLSVVQGISLAALLVYTQESIDVLLSYQTLLTLLRAVVIFLSIVIIWHKYTTHNRYVAWPLWWMDPLIPFVFGVFEFILTFQVKKSASLSRFSALMFSLSLCGGWAYLQTFVKHRRHETTVKSLYEEHFKNREFGEALYTFIDHFNKVCLWWMGGLTILFALGALISWQCYKNFLEWLIPCIYFLSLALLLVVGDLMRFIRRDSEMQKYFHH